MMNTDIVGTVEPSELSDRQAQFVVFRLNEEEYAVPILDVQEIIPTGDITPFPNSQDYVTGIINVRGTVATVLNLAKRFHLVREASAELDKYVMLVRDEKSLYGVQVDAVTSVMDIEESAIRSASSAETKIDADLVTGVAVIGDRVILVLDILSLLGREHLEVEQPGDASTPSQAAA
jgi:purine-binding chemotaxis protein CheW